MAYQTGTGTIFDPGNLITALKTFAENNGWTISLYSDSDSDNIFLMVTKGGHHFKFLGQNSSGFIYTGISADVDTNENFTNQPDSSPNVRTTYCLGPFVSYHFFEGSDFIHVVVERNANLFAHFGCGILEKSGSYVGGEYAYGTYLYENNQTDQDYYRHSYPFSSHTYVSQYYSDRNTVIRFDEDTLHYERFGYYNSSTRSARAIGNYQDGGPFNDMWNRMPNAYNGLSPLLPLMVFMRRTNDTYNMLGCVKEFRQTTMADRQPAEEIGIGSDTWIVFPIIGYGTSGADSGSYAIAYKKVV